MSKIFAIGRRSEILPFRAVGAALVEVEDAAGVAGAFQQVAREHEPCLVMIPEDLARACPSEVARFRAGKRRAVVAIPTLKSGRGGMLRQIRTLVARSLGVDLLGRSG